MGRNKNAKKKPAAPKPGEAAGRQQAAYLPYAATCEFRKIAVADA